MSEDIQAMKVAAEAQRQQQLLQQQQERERQRQAQQAAAEAAKVKPQTVTGVTPSHAEGYDIQRKTPKVYTGPKITSTTTVGEPQKPGQVTSDMLSLVGVGVTAANTGERFKQALETTQKLSDSFFDKSGLPSQIEVKKYLETNKPATGYVAGGVSPFKPKSIGEALNRIGYITTQAVIGVGKEGTFPASINIAPPKRESDVVLQAVGGVLFPSAMDYAATAVISKLVKTAKGNRILMKLLGKGEPELTPSEKKIYDTLIKGYEETPGRNGYSTAQIRAGIKKKYTTMESMVNYYKEHPYSAGGEGTMPQLMQEYEKVIEELGWEPEEFVDYLAKDAADIPVGVLTNMFIGVLDDGKTAAEAAADLDDYLDRPDKYKFDDRTPTKETTGETTEEVPEEETKQTPDVTPQEIPEETPQETPQQTLEEIPQQITEEVAEEEQEEKAGEEGLVVSGRRQRRGTTQRRSISRVSQGQGPRVRVRFTFPRRVSETLIVKASTLPAALQAGQRARKPRRELPVQVDLWPLGG